LSFCKNEANFSVVMLLWLKEIFTMPIVSTNTGWNLLPDFVTDTDAEHF